MKKCNFCFVIIFFVAFLLSCKEFKDDTFFLSETVSSHSNSNKENHDMEHNYDLVYLRSLSTNITSSYNYSIRFGFMSNPYKYTDFPNHPSPYRYPYYSISLLCPFGMGNLGTGPGMNEGIILQPLFVTEDYKTYVEFSLSHGCNCGTQLHTLKVTNSRGFDKKITISNQYVFKEMIPLNPNGDTVISVSLERKNNF